MSGFRSDILKTKLETAIVYDNNDNDMTLVIKENANASAGWGLETALEGALEVTYYPLIIAPL